MKLLFTFLFSLLLFSAYTQGDFRMYRTNDYMQSLKQSRGTGPALSTLERDLKNKLRYENPRDVLLPVVFHVLYANKAERLAVSKILIQLEILNEDFSDETRETFSADKEIGDRRNLEQYKSLRQSTRIQFCFPENPNGPAINYVKTSISEWPDYISMKQKASGATPWDTDKYLNIWVCNLPDENAGFAQMPNGPKDLDGIVIDYKYLQQIGDDASAYNGGHTLTHLVGNYLGLFPLWGETPCEDDYVNDTPIHNAPNFRCESINHISTCSGNPTEMINNFMDNTHDECLSMFTRGQMQRMQKVVQVKGPRGKLAIQRTACDTEEKLTEEPVLQRSTKEEELANARATLSVKPNPAREELFIEYASNQPNSTGYQIEIFSVSGQLIHRVKQPAGVVSTRLNVSDWQPGMYLLSIREGEQRQIEKIVVE
ncbi:MAG: zinc-dependent metalloprotease [Bacteroidota bacterium]